MTKLRFIGIFFLVAMPGQASSADPGSQYKEYLSTHRVYCVTGKKVIETISIEKCSNRHGGDPYDTEEEALEAVERKQGGSSVSRSSAKKLELIGSGTGFVVNRNYVVTASHVVDTCKSVVVRHAHSDYKTTVAATDRKNDLGLLKLDKPIADSAKLRTGKAVRLGEVIAVYGYPLSGLLSKSANISQGNINSLAGLGNDSGTIQYDAASQPGNSGGPLLDSSGNVIGVISWGFGKKYADLTDHLPQNINFAVKSYLVEGFLESNGVRYERAESTQNHSLVELAPKAEKFTVFVGCWK